MKETLQRVYQKTLPILHDKFFQRAGTPCKMTLRNGRRRHLPFVLLIAVSLIISLVYISMTSRESFSVEEWAAFTAAERHGLNASRCSKAKSLPNLAWILQFNYEPHPAALMTLLCFYASHFRLIVIVSPTGRVGQLLNVNTSSASAEVIWAEPCPNYLHGAVAGLMMRCYAAGLEILKSSPKFSAIEYVVLSNDDVILNMTKVKEFARDGHPVSHISPSDAPPPMFEPPPKTVPFFDGWFYAEWWPECQERFSKVPPAFKERFKQRQGAWALKGGVDMFFLPPESVPEFIFLSSVVSECWIEMSIPNALAMLTLPTKFYASEENVLIYRWLGYGLLIRPQDFEREISNHSIAAFHPFKLSYPEHRLALSKFMTKYKLN